MLDLISTYRIQFNKDFTFEHLETHLPYLQKLGVKTIYASPIFKAVPGSVHGYDVVDPNSINPEIGTLEQLRRISNRLKAANMNWLQDIVPNHMAFHSDNRWLADVLEHGENSAYASYFDILWHNKEHPGKLMVPILGSSLRDVIDNKELKIVFVNDRFWLKYYDNQLPVKPDTVKAVSGEQGAKAADVINGSTELLAQALQKQHYVLCPWRETEQHINYRRFFTINGLIGLNIQHEQVFNDYHRLIASLVEEDVFQGLRVDHIDGLFDPTTYLFRLREMVGDDVYIAVEKILQSNEKLPRDFPIEGTTGYDFLASVNKLFIDRDNEKAFNKFYQKNINATGLRQEIDEKKSLILYHYMNGELENLFRLFNELELAGIPLQNPIKEANLKKAIAQFLILCPVYRYYGDQLPLDHDEAKALQHIFERITTNDPNLADAVGLLSDALLIKPLEENMAFNEKALYFYQKCMQVTGPLMAKGVEDTLMYTYNSIIAHNEVGDSPHGSKFRTSHFHDQMTSRQQQWPYSMNATATHDTKRGEDVRARLNALVNMPEIWTQAVEEWMALNEPYKIEGAPDINDEYFIYQALIGSYPMPDQPYDNFLQRFQEYITKALREAKRHTDWAESDNVYEQNTLQFIDAILNKENAFWLSFQKVFFQVVDAGIVNSLVQVVLKFTCPGLPDTYQGCELWDLSMVDPDNRRVVDYELRTKMLDELGDVHDNTELMFTLWATRYTGKVKLWLEHLLLTERTIERDLFAKGGYISVEVKGKYKNSVIAYARCYGSTWYVFVMPLHAAAISVEQVRSVNMIDWDDTRIILPEHMPVNGRHVTTGTNIDRTSELNINDLFTDLPLAILKFKAMENRREAGILLPIFSLPSPYGVGDYGKSAMKFAEFLSRSGQKIWQILPINPTDKTASYSPYSSISSMAGNPMLISPELLTEDELLSEDDLKQFVVEETEVINYEVAEQTKEKICDKAYYNFATGRHHLLEHQFRSFCEANAYWLDEFALFVALKQHLENKSWFDWPEPYKNREADALAKFATDNADELKKIKWLQFIVDKQWQKLKAHCNSMGIKLFGDIAFYVAYDSVAVWAHPEIFSLDAQGAMTGIAGVPPDYFSEDGQLWGMPTFKWDVLRERDYDWWIDRLKRNLTLFDIVRIDHFRAFAEYWQVPAGATTARNGEWLNGPGLDFFEVVREHWSDLPLVAEDLGYNMENVYALRKETNLPGMKVLQFAFGDNMPHSVDIPHNYPHDCFAYTGTHDNNTTIGWYKNDTDKADHKRMEQYFGVEVSKKNIHLVMARAVYASVARVAVLPIQDVLGLDEAGRMNLPGTVYNNWVWKLPMDALTKEVEDMLCEWTWVYNRR